MANKITLRHAEIARKNFRGAERRDKAGHVVNSEGNRNFLLIIPDDMVTELIDDGYTVKDFRPDENGNADSYIQVKVGFQYKPPTVWLVTAKSDGTKKRTRLTEGTINQIDELAPSDIKDIKIVVRPVPGEDRNGNPKITPWLETMYVEIDDMDPFADDYDFADENDGYECPFE